MWTTKLKIAIVEQDTDSMNKLLDNIPQIEDKQEIQTAIYLLQEASLLVESMRERTKTSMSKIKQNLNFLKSTQENKASSLDITS